MNDADIKYDEWCKRIAESRDIDKLITHFREHVCEHYNRHNCGRKEDLDVWLVGALNFMYILKKKCPYITTEDLLFKLCTHHKNNEGGPDAPFDIDKFIEEYDGKIKEFQKSKRK